MQYLPLDFADGAGPAGPQHLARTKPLRARPAHSQAPEELLADRFLLSEAGT
jgi:hypothetical protein